MLLFQFFLVRIHILVRSLEHVRHSMILLRIIQSDPGGYDIPPFFFLWVMEASRIVCISASRFSKSFP